MNATEIVQKLQLVQALLQELLPAAQALQRHGPDKLERALHAVRKYSEADKARWRHLAASPDLFLHKKRSAGRIIARREGLPEAAVETIRRAI